MSEFGFNKEEIGYSIPEVDKYIKRLHEEYRNAVEWSNEIEKKAEEASDSEAFSVENEILKSENENFAAENTEIKEANNALSNANEELIKENQALKAENEKLSSDCHVLAAKLRELLQNNDNIENAKEAAATIIAGAQEQAGQTVRGSEERAAAILHKAEQECQSIILDASHKIEEIKEEINALYHQKEAVTGEISDLLTMRSDLLGRLDRVKELLDI